MADTYALDVQARHVTGKQVRQLRRDDLVPAVIYGAGGQALSLSCPRRPLEILLGKAGGTNVIKLTLEGHEENALVRNVQRHPVRRSLIHVDFLRVDLTKKLKTEVPIVLINLPKLAAEFTMSHYMTQIEVECLPGDIPDRIEVDLSGLRNPGDQLTVGQLPTTAKVTYLADPSDVIARVEAAATGGAEEVEAEVVEPTAAEPELSTAKGKKEEEGEE
ncbi:MAG: 50S ribosomal protein L25 [Aggregatilineales bacterium]